MAKRRNGELLFGFGLLAVAASLAYLRITPEQKKKLAQLKDNFLGEASDHIEAGSGKIKDVTDSISEQGEVFTEVAGEKFEAAKEQSQTYADDILKVVEDKFEEFKSLLQKK